LAAGETRTSPMAAGETRTSPEPVTSIFPQLRATLSSVFH
jgi:hypothetical protein